MNGLADGEDSVREGDRVVYIKEFSDRQGKYRAVHVRRAGSENGVVSSWDAMKGFGFIQPNDGGEDIFCHISAIEDEEYADDVQTGDQVTYMRRFSNRSGKFSAVDVRFVPDFEEESRGTMQKWSSTKEFGFIRPHDGGGDVYCRISSLPDGKDSVKEGDYVKYVMEFQPRSGRYHAVNVRVDADKGAYRGTLLRWDSERAFGFIQRSKAREDIFFHVSSLANHSELDRIKEGNEIMYMKEFDNLKGKTHAVNVRLAPPS
eukprot:gnl/TRDRNA2_/TRDRNA2_109867_c0_seq1.p1 gnl/TRDRNA2_/TRDRNA2_109867_c0~~gnl/TRDRNA2_/TRDRNA2_109867_c0_seq1.p1  ORF type:complete len:296 (+),score=58.26 gnl/TRDRNA2_/TRDRNA2_109867_c0_seq1:109-888(+)